MNAVSIRELHGNTGEWVRRAADSPGGIVVTDRGRPVAVLRHFSGMVSFGAGLPDREKLIRRLPRIDVDSTGLVEFDRGEP
jgi:hypothetical protein